MARIPESDLERLKEEVSVQRLIEASGVVLKKGGKDFTGICPFHADATASLVVTPHKNLWHCFGCQMGGGPIDWVMKLRGVSFRHAVELLKQDISGGGVSAVAGHFSLAADSADMAATAATPVKRTSVRSLPAPVAFDTDEQALLSQTIAYYHQRLKASPEARAFLAARGLDHPGLVDAFRLGVADRTLGLSLPEKNRKDGAAIRSRLQKVGLIRGSGHEHFNGSLVVPVFDAAGAVTEIYGRKLRDDLRPGTPKHLYLPGPHAGVFNLAGVLAAGAREPGEREVILCEALIDAMTFWCAGFTNVTSSYGIEGFTGDILAAFKAGRDKGQGIERILIAYDRDEPGGKAAGKLAPVLIAEGFEVLRVLFPMGMDANSYARQMAPAQGGGLPQAASALALVLRQAQWLGGVRPVAAEASSLAADPHPNPLPQAGEGVIQSHAQNVPPAQVVPAQVATENIANTAPTDLPDELHLTTGQGLACLSWRIRGWKKNTTPEAMRVNVQVRRGDADAVAPGAAAVAAAGYFVDTLDLFAARSRQAFVRAASVELGLSEDALKRDLGTVLVQLETLQDELMAQVRKPAGPAAPILSADEEQAALALLRAPDLMARIVADLHALGVVGEDTNLLAAYLAAVSRKLDSPLAVLIQSTSAAGKSALMDAVLSLMPEEQCLRYSAMTGQSLYYLGENNLSHKILAISEEEGVRQAAYALKLLQSEGTLTIASTAKDEQTGNLVTKQYSVRGPVMLMLTTTAIDVDEELLNRCLVLSVNESREQTAAIHARQRHKQTLAGLLQGAEKASITTLHHNAQRLLSSVAVVNPYADRLSFLSDKTRTRRDHMKYLTLIRAITLLHQHQRPVKTVSHCGQELAYIEVTKADIALANSIAHEVLGRTLDELPPQTRRLLNLTRTMVRERASAERIPASEVRFTRRDIRDATQWSDNQLKVHCARLADMEYLLIHGGSRGHSLRYELLWDGGEDAERQRHLCGLIDLATLEEAPPSTDRPALRPSQVGVSGAQVGAKLAPSLDQVGAKLEGVQPPPGRADIGLAAHAPRNGAKPHSCGASSLVAGPVAHMDMATATH
jgi:DNA primase